MKLNELVAAAKAAQPKALGNLDEKRVVRLVQTVLAEAAKQLGAIKEGQVDLIGFGRFIVKQREVEKDGKKMQKKRIVFRPARGGAGGKKGKGGAARKRAGAGKASPA